MTTVQNRFRAFARGAKVSGTSATRGIPLDPPVTDAELEWWRTARWEYVASAFTTSVTWGVVMSIMGVHAVVRAEKGPHPLEWLACLIAIPPITALLTIWTWRIDRGRLQQTAIREQRLRDALLHGPDSGSSAMA
jgi:hypothetical protein